MNSTFLWRQNTGDRYFYKFWGQVIRHVARQEKDTTISRIEVHPQHPRPGQDVEVELWAVGVDKGPSQAADHAIDIKGPEGALERLAVKADQRSPGRYRARTRFTQPGYFELSFSGAPNCSSAELNLPVLASVEELRHPNINRKALAMLV